MSNEIVLNEQLEKGGIILDADEKIIDNKIVKKSLEEQVHEGLISLEENEKIVNNTIVVKSLKEQVSEGILFLAENEKIVNNEIVPKTLEEQQKEGLIELDNLFQYIENNEIKIRSVEEVISNNLIKSQDDCSRVLQIISLNIEDRIVERYSNGYELKLTKDYTLWLSDGKPQNDKREDKFNEMSAYINSIRAEYKPLKDKVKKILELYS